ncbi:MAG: SMP-30/gluconolactonase/LRE family protein [Rhodoferax sp.]|nr:SMP-30/gluconolactonase/LRE family protein [Rhodoferax sp.]
MNTFPKFVNRLMEPRHAARAVGVSALVAAFVVLAGCAGNAPVAEEKRLVWPEPPETARVEFVRSITSDEDLNKDTTSSQSILKFLEGEKPAKNRIVEPMGIAVSDDGERVYISDKVQGGVFVYDFAKKTSLKIGEDKRLAMPMGVAIDAQENVYVAEQQRKGVSVFDRTGKLLRFITDASITRPNGVAIDKERKKLYVVDTANSDSADHTVKVFDLDGKMLGKLGLGKGNADGAMLYPTYITVGPKGHVLVSDTLNSRLQEFDADGKFLRSIGKLGNAYGEFDKPKGVGFDTFGNIYAVDSGWSNVQIFNDKGQIMLFFGGRGTYPGLMQNPGVLTIDKKNRIYVGDILNHRVNVYQLVNTTAEDSVAKEDPKAKKEAAKDGAPKPAAAAK